jgi:hypothetical protein
VASARSCRASGDADELQLDVKRLAIERLHHIFVRSGLKCREICAMSFSVVQKTTFGGRCDHAAGAASETPCRSSPA